MSKAVMLAIQPQHIKNIIPVIDAELGDLVSAKTIEVRKTAPTIATPFKCYIYMTATKERCRFWEYITAYQNSNGEILDGSQKVIGEFVCDKIDTYVFGDMDIPMPAYDGDSTCWEFDDGYYITNGELKQTSLTYEQLCDYGKGKTLYGLHISNLKIYDKPKELYEFNKFFPCELGKQRCGLAEWEERNKWCEMCSMESIVVYPPQSWFYVKELSLNS